MTSVVKEYSSVAELIKSIDEIMANYRKQLGEMLRKLEELRIKTDQEKQIKTLLTRLGIAETAKPNEVDLKGVKLIYNPSPYQELTSIEAIVESINSKVTTLSSIRKDLEPLSGIDLKMKIVVVYIDDIPKTIMLKTD